MILNLRIRYRKIKLNIFTIKCGLNHEKTQKESEKLDKLINKYYKSTEK